jgi:cyclase
MAWTRRGFVRISALGLAAGALPFPLYAAPRQPDPFRLLRRNVGTFTGRGGVMGWLVNPDGSLIVDSQFPDSATLCLEGLAARAALPIDALVNTHHHSDHTSGNPIFREAATRIVAHRNVPDLQRRAAGEAAGEVVVADTTFDVEWSLELGDERVRATHHGPAHTAGDAIVTFENAGVTHMGDLVFNRLFPFIDREGGASIQGWIHVLETTAAGLPPDTIFIFGHGNPEFGTTGTMDDLLVQRDFLTALLDAAHRGIARGHSREEVTGLERLDGFPDHIPPSARLTLGNALGAAWDELTDRP